MSNTKFQPLPIPLPFAVFDEFGKGADDRVQNYAAAAVAAEREQMIADGWRQTRYVAPVTDCEACLTPDACAIRGQCAHYLRERA